MVRIGLDKDLDGWRPEKGTTDKYGQEIEDREYNESDFDRNLILEQRTTVVAYMRQFFLEFSPRIPQTPSGELASWTLCRHRLHNWRPAEFPR